MEPSSFCSTPNLSKMMKTSDRSFCFSTQLENTDVLFMDCPSRGSSHRCINDSMGKNVCICFSTNMSHSQSHSVHETLSLQNNTDSSVWAETPSVPGTVGNE
ncbi:hypothetical protein DPMN_003202 [Dreissena polymorpha]|uniref:Uncharacterized protein n=1 Tax=Dreissena polymorpha TaxID=45954 RepID=A0A9D4RUI3_DREPO|nr:hypothetical protein DPMN_003202 [Dreissena polymorpha]